ncbi:MAG: hypothetical protein DCF19_04725 [Pseudanabaena frigida]|uniref:Lipocalin-like domain-containing protein n=1 Tax=Pseudanabaena frigida TaxID=945775 RepID=A0A2W4Y744_9CYAN|nr:MAG: hypothetical protein DCF19_04725 [Pseudanabaena frigida]
MQKLISIVLSAFLLTNCAPEPQPPTIADTPQNQSSPIASLTQSQAKPKVASNSSRPPLSKFVGKWLVTDKNGNKYNMEFTANGLLTSSADGYPVSGNISWAFADDTHLIFGNQNTAAFRFEGNDTLIIGEPPEVLKYQRVK